MHFLVTGGAGFIGSHVARQLLLEGHDVTVIDNLKTGRLSNLPTHSHLRIISKNVLDCQPQDFVQPVHGIAHLAATPSVTESWLYPLEAHHNNLSTTIAVLLLCKALGISRLVFASSAAVYGNTTESSISEIHPTVPISPYGLQKLVSEQYINLLASSAGLSFVALRMFNVFGPGQRIDSPYSGVISIFTAAMQKNRPIKIYGDGSQTRDFVYVEDIASAFESALITPLPTGSCITCNLGTGQGTSLLQLVGILKSCFPYWRAGVDFAHSRAGDIQHSQADISQASYFLNFRPQWSVDSGIRRLVQSLTDRETVLQ